MKKIKINPICLKYLFTISLLVNSINLFAQSSIQFKLLDSASNNCIQTKQNNIIVENAITKKLIFNKKTSTCILDTTISNGTYLVTAFAEGYKSITKTITISDTATNPIYFYLSHNIKMLKEVIVKPKMKKFISFQDDKLIVQISNNPLLNTGDTYDALERTPGIMIAPDGTLILKGKTNVTIWVDGKPTGLSGDNLASLLRNFPANAIDRFEIISNPGAGYDANSAGGTINIVTVKGKIIGNTYAISTDVSKSINLKTLTSFRYNNRSKHSNTMWLLGYSTEKKETTTNSDYIFNPAVYNRFNANLATNKSRQPFLLATYDNDLNSRLNIYTSVNIAKANSISDNNNNMSFLSNSTLFWNTISSKDAILNYQNYSIGSTYILKKKTNYKLSVNLNYLKTINDIDNNYAENNNLASQNKILYSIVNNNTNRNNWTYETKVSLPFKKHGYGLNGGVKINSNKINSVGKYNLQNSQPIQGISYNKISGYNFNEQVNAAFFEISKKRKKMNISGGLRYENTNTTSINTNGIKYFDTTYSNIFPSLRANADFNVIAFDLSYSKKIVRPAYANLDPNIIYIDSFNLKQGNPFLQPTFSNNFEMGVYIKGYPLITYSLTNEKNATLLATNAYNGLLNTTFINVAKINSHNIFCVLPIPFQLITSPRQIVKDLKANKLAEDNTNYLALFYNYNKSIIQSAFLSLPNKPIITFGAMFKVDIKKLLSISGYYNNYQGGNSYFYTTKKYQTLDITCSKYLLAKKLLVKIYGRDFFNGLEQNTLSNYNSVQIKSMLKTETQRFGISILYSFGKFVYQNREKQNININDAKGQGNYKTGVQ